MSEPTGPDPRNLRGLRGMIPSLQGGIFTRSVTGKGRKIKIPLPTRPRKICRVCAKLFDLAACPGDSPLAPGECDECAKTLKEGYVALISGDKYAFVRSARLNDLAGQVIRISGANMEKIQQEFDVNWSNREDAE